MDYEDLDSILRAKESDHLRNGHPGDAASVDSIGRVREWLSTEATVDSPAPPPPSAADALSVIYAQINRGDRNNSRSVECWNSQSNMCPYEENGDELYSVVRKTSASAGYDIYRGGGDLYSTVDHTRHNAAASPDFYQLEKPLESSSNYFADDQQPEDFYDFPFNPYEEVTIRNINDRRYDFAAAADLDESELYSCIRSDDKIDDRQKPASMSLTGAMCTRCQQGFSKDEEIVNSNGQIWHRKCFVCGQCFQQFPDGIFYEFEGRKYCVHDFNVLFAPCCGLCKEFIIGRVIKAMNLSWHPDCFSCQLCQAPLADAGFIKNAGRALCRECNAKEKARGTGKYVCHKCHSIIEEGHIKFKGEAYHPYHFNCTTCSVELNADAREKGGELYCLRCHDKMGIPICGACRRPIEERVVYALGKAWHVEHFVCAKCEKPFLGTRHYEKKGLAYCETHYHQLFGNICFVCNCVVAGDVFTALNKAWCVDHFACSVCDRKMSQKTKFFEVDLKPVCKMCYEKFPAELKKRLKKAYDQQMKK